MFSKLKKAGTKLDTKDPLNGSYLYRVKRKRLLVGSAGSPFKGSALGSLALSEASSVIPDTIDMKCIVSCIPSS